MDRALKMKSVISIWNLLFIFQILLTVGYFRKKIGKKLCCKISDHTQEKQTPESFEMIEPEESESLMATTKENNHSERAREAELSTSPF